MRWMHAQWPAVNNLLFCFIGNRDTTLFSARTPLGQGLQAHSSRIHRIEKVKSQFYVSLLLCIITLTIKEGFLMAWINIGVLYVRWRDASQLLKAIWWKTGYTWCICYALKNQIRTCSILSFIVMMNHLLSCTHRDTSTRTLTKHTHIIMHRGI